MAVGAGAQIISPLPPMSVLSGVPLIMLTVSPHSFNLGSCLRVPGTALDAVSCVNLRHGAYSHRIHFTGGINQQTSKNVYLL